MAQICSGPGVAAIESGQHVGGDVWEHFVGRRKVSQHNLGAPSLSSISCGVIGG